MIRPYPLSLRAINNAGVSPSTEPAPLTVYTYPPAPTLSANGIIIIMVTAGTNTNGSITTNYQWSKDNVTWTTRIPAQITSPWSLIPSGLSAGSSYTIYVRAINTGILNGSNASISITYPAPTYVAPIIQLPPSEITAGSIGTEVSTITSSFGTILGPGALANSNVKNVDLSASTNITFIPENTFAGSDVVSVTLPDTVSILYANAFANCPNLKTLNITRINTIGEAALQGTAISTITITGAANIAAWALSRCESMVQATF